MSFNELIIKEENITAIILDEEGDPIECSFLHNNCVKIDTSKYTYLTLSIENLEILKKLTIQAELKYKQIFKD